jgi:branched-chain amino acid aminotransferase
MDQSTRAVNDPALANLLSLSIWRDGEVVDSARATVSVWDHGLLYGDGVFEGIRIRSGRIYRPYDHLARLRGSARATAIEIPYSDAELLAGIAATARANGLDEAHVRVIVARGVGLPGIDPARCPTATTLILVYPFPPLLGSEPVTLIVSSVARKSPRSVPARVKSLSYLDSVLAKVQANAAGAGDALMLDGSGFIAEATGANVFCVHGSVLRTPPVTASLSGITRGTVLDLAATAGLEARVEVLEAGDLYAADEVFLTGTGAGIVPVRAIDGRDLPPAPGRYTTAIEAAYRSTWADPAYSVALSDLD